MPSEPGNAASAHCRCHPLRDKIIQGIAKGAVSRFVHLAIDGAGPWRSRPPLDRSKIVRFPSELGTEINNVLKLFLRLDYRRRETLFPQIRITEERK